MSCKNCEENHSRPRRPPPPPPPHPCLPCALEHLALAKDAAGNGRRHLAIWHLARAAELAPQAATVIKSARIEYQKSGRPINWDHLQRLIK
jgi:hypothetical protein